MKTGDLVAAAIVACLALLMTVWRGAYDAAYAFSPALMAFAKFSILATFGETLVSRVTTGRYVRSGFGLVPKAIVWGVLGVVIYAAFVVFDAGATKLYFSGVVPVTFAGRLLRAFLISVSMNIIFAPVLMTTHQVTDLFIAGHGGSFPVADFRPGALLAEIDWRRMWSFVFVRTIPLFWIPAHTVTFLLPSSVRVLFAAGLSVALGLFMALVRPPDRRPEDDRHVADAMEDRK